MRHNQLLKEQEKQKEVQRKEEERREEERKEEGRKEEERIEEERKEEERNEEERKKDEKRKQQEAEYERQLKEHNEGLNELSPDNEGEALPKLNPPPQQTTTTVKPTKRLRPNITDPICALPVQPEFDVDFDAGYRFGTSSDSHIEFTQIPNNIKKAYEISLQFRTSSSDGVLFYAADNRHTDYIGLYLQDGRLYHSFNCGSGLANISSKFNHYNNNEWHTVLFTRQHANGKLIINGDDEQSGQSSGTTKGMNVQAPYSFGGVSGSSFEDMSLNLLVNKGVQFNGCIRNIQMGGRSLGEPSTAVSVLPCSDKVEPGIFFGKSGGYVKLRDRFKVGTDLSIEMDIKPRTTDGLLLSVHGKKAYLILELNNGTIQFTIDNGDGPIVAVFKPEAGQNFCDGNWHKVMAIKSSYVITVTVDNVAAEPKIGNAANLSTDTSRPLYLGGHQHLARVRGLTVRKPYLGCMRNIKIRKVDEIITPAMTVGNIQTGVCPTI